MSIYNPEYSNRGATGGGLGEDGQERRGALGGKAGASILGGEFISWGQRTGSVLGRIDEW